MMSLPILQLLVYGFALWFGLYLVARGSGKAGMQFAGSGLICYALGVALASMGRFSPALAAELAIWYPVLALLPAIFWFGAVWSLLPEPYRAHLPTSHFIALSVAVVLVVAAALITRLDRWVLAVAPVVLAVVALRGVWLAFRGTLPRPPLKVLFTATVFFALGGGLLILPLEVIADDLVLLAIGGDLALLGYAIAKLDAYDEGTAFLPDALRSLASVGVVSALIGGQLFLVLALAAPPTALHMLLAYSVFSTVIALFTLQSLYQRLVDRFIFGEKTRLAQERQTLITVSDALPRLDEALTPLTLDEAEFVRLTRRTLTNLNDLSKLVASPLTRLPLITTRLRMEGQPDTSLGRAQELRRLLTDHILRLKPYSDKDFDTGDEWRYYNVLYFPYVVGLKPYSVRLGTEAPDASAKDVLEWFHTYVPERTLYNWQTAAAKLIARQLREADAQTHGQARTVPSSAQQH